jgi:hypothetical protein
MMKVASFGGTGKGTGGWGINPIIGFEKSRFLAQFKLGIDWLQLGICMGSDLATGETCPSVRTYANENRPSRPNSQL